LRLKRPKAKEFLPFETWEQVETVADELDPRYRAIPLVLVGTGLRPEELWAVERRDLDLEAGVLTVSRVFSGGQVKEPKTERSKRRVPLRARVVEAIKAQPPRMDTPLLFPAPRGGHIDGEKFRYREWAAALRAADVEYRRPYDCRHTFASWAIQDGVHLFELSRVMGGHRSNSWTRYMGI
jgi:integrase